MWPFTRAGAMPDPVITRAEFDDIKLRLKALEREHDDLHAAYRRMRGGVRHDVPKDQRDGSGSAPASGAPITKDQLRAQARTILAAQRKGSTP